MRQLLIDLAPLIVVPVLFVAILVAGSPTLHVRTSRPHEAYDANHCTWYCHNHGCRHTPRLPSVLTSDEGLFGQTIRAFFAMGHVLVPSNRGYGYGAANLLVFCAIWPGAMYALYLVALRQRRRLRTQNARSAS